MSDDGVPATASAKGRSRGHDRINAVTKSSAWLSSGRTQSSFDDV